MLKEERPNHTRTQHIQKTQLFRAPPPLPARLTPC